MSTQVSDGTATVEPLLCLGYSAERPSRNRVHTIIGVSSPDVTLEAAGLRMGTLEFLLETFADALALEAMLSQALVFTVTDSDLTALSMSFVVDEGGRIRVQLDPETRDRWTVSVDFQEVTAS